MTDPAQTRAQSWAATMNGNREQLGVRRAHADSVAQLKPAASVDRERREEMDDVMLAPGATRASGAGVRPRAEEPDPYRTCFERDRDRIVHSTPFRRLAGKTQVFVFPEDHQRTRLTHALEVAQVATAIARAVGVNVALVEAIALGHDCGHGPGGHASEDAFSPYVDEGYDHAVWGADVVVSSLNLCVETTDGIRNHSWSRPAPSTPEGEIVSWADRIAYVCHDFEDACDVGIVSAESLPAIVVDRCGERRSRQLNSFIAAVVETAVTTGTIGMDERHAEALAAFRRFNYDHIYMRPASVDQSASVIRILRGLVDHFADHPDALPGPDSVPGVEPTDRPEPGSSRAVREAVTYVAGMTDRFAFDQARRRLRWAAGDLPVGIG